MPVKKKLKSVKSNVVKMPKKNNITLDKKDGVLITALDHYRAKNLERWLTIDDCCLILPDLLKKRTWESWRARYKQSGDEIGPQFKLFGLAIYKIKVLWLCRYKKGLNWEQEPQQTAANNNDQLTSASGNI